MGLFEFAKPALFSFDPEKAHGLSIKALKSGLLPPAKSSRDPKLKVSLGGLEFPNPLGLAAGYDKNAEVSDAILKLGFGFTEVGTITPRAQPGNPKPRLFRLEAEKAVINRLGFNNQGHKAALQRLEARKGSSGIVGVNIGANKDSEDFVADYEMGIDTFYHLASYFTANISSPNTPGLRNLQAGEALKVLLERIFERVEAKREENGRDVPVFLKIAPDLEAAEMDEIAEVINQSGLAGLIVSNTTLDRDMLANKIHANEAGGLSGKPLFAKSTRVLAEMYSRIGDRLPLIGVGGILNAEDAIGKLEAGASLVQVYSGLVYGGPCLPAKIVEGILRHLDRSGLDSVSELTGSNIDRWIT
ncbi:MAG: quinone-dependent dihydroorotate dehydrogenase [Pseudomonadota bacterium]